jgi:hypothetical protein
MKETEEKSHAYIPSEEKEWISKYLGRLPYLTPPLYVAKM